MSVSTDEKPNLEKFYILSRATSLLCTVLSQAIKQASGLSLNEYMVLREIDRTLPNKRIDQQRIVIALFITPSALSTIVRGLGNRSLISIIEDRSDRRRQLLTITELGQQQFNKARQIKLYNPNTGDSSLKLDVIAYNLLDYVIFSRNTEQRFYQDW